MTEKFNTIEWFQIAADDPDRTQRFYGELFGWSFAPDRDAAERGVDYREIFYPGESKPVGGLAPTGPHRPAQATFFVSVPDVEEVCARVERLGGEVSFKNVGHPPALDLAELRDPAGNLFGVFRPQ